MQLFAPALLFANFLVVSSLPANLEQTEIVSRGLPIFSPDSKASPARGGFDIRQNRNWKEQSEVTIAGAFWPVSDEKQIATMLEDEFLKKKLRIYASGLRKDEGFIVVLPTKPAGKDQSDNWMVSGAIEIGIVDGKATDVKTWADKIEEAIQTVMDPEKTNKIRVVANPERLKKYVGLYKMPNDPVYYKNSGPR